MASPRALPDTRAAARAAQTLQPDGGGRTPGRPPLSANDPAPRAEGILVARPTRSSTFGGVRATSLLFGLFLPLCALTSSGWSASSRASSVEVQFVL